MRCASAVYNILGLLQIVDVHSKQKTSRNIFYPRILRKLLLKKACEHNWFLYREPGKGTRKWDKD
jgi:hypothetical protein